MPECIALKRIVSMLEPVNRETQKNGQKTPMSAMFRPIFMLLISFSACSIELRLLHKLFLPLATCTTFFPAKQYGQYVTKALSRTSNFLKNQVRGFIPCSLPPFNLI